MYVEGVVISERDKESTYTRGLLHPWVGGSCTSLAFSFAHDQAHAPEAYVHIYTVVRGKILPDLKVSSDNNDTEMNEVAKMIYYSNSINFVEQEMRDKF